MTIDRIDLGQLRNLNYDILTSVCSVNFLKIGLDQYIKHLKDI